MLIARGHLVDPAQRLDAVLDVRLRGGVVVEIGEHLEAQSGEETIDASGAYVAPGFIDMHAHLREPGSPEKETLATGCAAAVAGGFTALAAMPNTLPAIDTPELVNWMRDRAREIGLARVYPIAAITQGRKGETLSDFTALAHAGAVAFSDDGNTIMDNAVMYAAAQRAVSVGAGMPLITHCEDERLKQGSVMTLGPTSRKLGLPGAPSLCEDVIVARDILVAGQTGCALHIAHVSTERAVELVRWAKSAQGENHAVHVTCEVAPHHLVFTEADVARLGAGAKVNPPLRFEQDVRALREAVRDGTVDALATDHAPHTHADKGGDLNQACVGFSGLEIAIGAYAYALPDLPVSRFVELLSTNPARILRVPGGTLALGAPADVTIFANRPWTVDTARFHSKGRSTPFSTMTLPRRAIATIVAGNVVMQDGCVRAAEGNVHVGT